MPPHSEPGQKHPAVILMHGLGGNRHEHGGLFIKLASALARTGFIALRIDFRGSGETGGSTLDMSLSTQVQDALDAFDYLASHTQVDSESISMLGLSFGGLTAAIAAQKRNVATLVLWEAAYDMLTSMKNCWGRLSLKSIRARGYMQAGMMQLSTTFFDELESINVAEEIKSFDKPTLVVQGERDSVVTVETAYQWKRSLVACQTDVELLPEAEHAFPCDDDAWKAINITVDWLQRQL